MTAVPTHPAARRSPPALVALTAGDANAFDPRASAIARILAVARALADDARVGFLLREPRLSDRDTLAFARALRAAAGAGTWIALHDRVHLARAAEVDAVHLGWRSLAPLEARAVVDARVSVGLSAHASDDPRAWAHADHVVFGPVFDTPSKRGLVDPVGLDGLARAVAASPVPVWALGGITPERVAAVRASGVRGVAVLGGIVHAADPVAAARAYLDPETGARPGESRA